MGSIWSHRLWKKKHAPHGTAQITIITILHCQLNFYCHIMSETLARKFNKCPNAKWIYRLAKEYIAFNSFEISKQHRHITKCERLILQLNWQASKCFMEVYIL